MMRKSLAMALFSDVGAFVGMDKAVMAMHQPTGSTWSYPAHDGHSVAHGKRMAAKARNQRRHKRATQRK